MPTFLQRFGLSGLVELPIVAEDEEEQDDDEVPILGQPRE